MKINTSVDLSLLHSFKRNTHGTYDASFAVMALHVEQQLAQTQIWMIAVIVHCSQSRQSQEKLHRQLMHIRAIYYN